LENPRRCNFDPAALLRSGADDLASLTSPQVEAVKKIYAGASNPRTGKQIFPGLERAN
jgi:feruloyl esterase